MKQSKNEYMRVYILNRYHRRRLEAFRILGSVCSACGAAEGLEIDHIDPKTKEFTVSKAWSVSTSKFLAEIAKCQLLCRKCHKAKTSIQLSVEHGGGVSGKKNCPCTLCKARKSEYMRGYKQSR